MIRFPTKKALIVKRKSFIPLFSVLCGIALFFAVRCTQSTKPLEKPRLTAMADTTVNAGDTIRLYTIPVFSPDSITGYRWYFPGAYASVDTTRLPFVAHVWALWDSGQQRFTVTITDAMHGVSDSATTQVFVRVCRPAILLSGDSTVFAGDTGRYLITQTGACAAKVYLWSFSSGISFSDTTFSPTIVKCWGLSDTGIRTLVAYARTQTGIPSFPETLSVFVRACRPTIALSGDSVGNSGDSSRYTVSVSGGCSIQWYIWSFMSGVSLQDTTFNPTVLKHWSQSDTGLHKLVVTAQTQLGLTSLPDTLSVKVVSCMPTVRVNGDSIAFPLDTTRLFATGASNCRAIGSYIWSFDGGVSYKDSLLSSFYLKQWGVGDTGSRHIAVKAITTNGLVSYADSLAVRVRSDVSPVQLPHDTTIRANDTASISAQIISSKSTISRFFWTVDHAPQEITTLGNTLRYSWPPASVGVHSIKLRVTDDHMTGSIIDSMSITVFTQMPTLAHPRDTLLPKSDTLLVTLSASESGSRIVTYLWNIGGLT